MSRYYAFDTETINREGHGEACMLIAENDNGGADYVKFPKSFEQIFNFLIGGKYIAFNADFDIRAIIHPRYVAEKTLEQIAEYDCGIYKQFRFFVIPGKYMKCWAPGRGGFEIFDLRSFFQGHSLESAAKTFLPKRRKLKIPKDWYTEIDRCLLDKREKRVVEYAVEDVLVLRDLYKVLNESFEACGLEDPPLFSPGAAASVISGPLIKEQDPGDEVNEIFRRSYFGGRIEVAEMGAIVGPLNYYDLKSAYPAAAAELPDLKTAAFRQGRGQDYTERRDVKAGCYEVIVNIPDSWNFGPFPKKDQYGKVYFPVGEFRGFIGKAGMDVIKKYRLEYCLVNFWEYYGGSAIPPFKGIINKLYPERKDPQKSLAIKLILNSGFYGKMAESTNYCQALPPELEEFAKFFNSDRLYGKYTNFVYAAAITEITRIKLWEAAHRAGAVLLATDGIITRGKLKRENKLGGWDLKGELKKAIILGCGRYKIIFKDGHEEFHFRGFRGPKNIFKRLEKCRGNKLSQKLLDTKSLKQWALSLDRRDFNVLKDLKKDIIIEDNKRFWEDKKFPAINKYFRASKLSLPIKE